MLQCCLRANEVAVSAHFGVNMCEQMRYDHDKLADHMHGGSVTNVMERARCMLRTPNRAETSPKYRLNMAPARPRGRPAHKIK